ncbi:MAG: hypothetical protein JWR11_154 [Mycobacterium sp.]|nr:hypothetical protein [Mycobacterium sp.]MDT5176645.1 hypothetical protein [Mycobacterium sp.]
MKPVADSGVLTVGPRVSDVPAVAVLELSGAVLEWTVDDPDGAATPRMTVTDVVAADWLWRILGPTGHAAIVSEGELADVDYLPEALEPLRRLAIGYWLRRWWPQSSRDGIVRLDHALLDGELAVLVSAAQEFFTEDTLDSDVEGLLAPHQEALLALEQGGDPRVVEMVRACTELADETGAWSSELAVPQIDSTTGSRDDYALAAGRDRDLTRGAIARGFGSVDWVAVPSGTFDAAEDTVDWAIESADSSVIASVRVALTGEATARSVDVRLHSGEVVGTGVLDANGAAALTLTGADGRELTENQAWDHDWSATTVSVGPHRTGVDSTEATALRQRIREFARARLAHPGPDAFLAEIVAAESDY